ncbi:MAG: DNA polymerase III subunit delta' [Methyloprofundus sp.]|nr:DNA polymerase III subunit delta' [Methyloprofundus sp.]
MDKLIYPWHKKDWQQLSAYITQDRIPQALLLAGSEGLAKHALALRYTQSLLCTEKTSTEACLQCESCKLFLAETHPDFMTLQPEEEGKAIRIDDVRALINKLSLKPQYLGYRVVLIQPADKMNMNSANAFLKCLEEPPERTVFLLLTEAMQALPATILSRCQKMSLSVPDTEDILQWLEEQGINEQAELALNLAQGSPLLALDYAKNNVVQLRSSCFDEWNKVALANACPISLAEKWHKQPLGPLLQWLTLWTEDIVKCTFHVESALLFNKDLAKPLQQLAKRVNRQQLFKFYDLLLKDSYRINGQLNKQLLFEELLITWSTVAKGKKI